MFGPSQTSIIPRSRPIPWLVGSSFKVRGLPFSLLFHAIDNMFSRDWLFILLSSLYFKTSPLPKLPHIPTSHGTIHIPTSNTPFTSTLVFRRITCYSLPLRPWRNSPITIAIILPIRVSYDFLLTSNKCFNWTHPIFLLLATSYPCQWNNSIVNDDSDLGSWLRGTFQNWS